MTVPFHVREVSYSAEAILARIEFLERALDHGSMIVVSSSVWSLDGSTRIVSNSIDLVTWQRLGARGDGRSSTW